MLLDPLRCTWVKLVAKCFERTATWVALRGQKFMGQWSCIPAPVAGMLCKVALSCALCSQLSHDMSTLLRMHVRVLTSWLRGWLSFIALLHSSWACQEMKGEVKRCKKNLTLCACLLACIHYFTLFACCSSRSKSHIMKQPKGHTHLREVDRNGVVVPPVIADLGCFPAPLGWCELVGLLLGGFSAQQQDQPTVAQKQCRVMPAHSCTWRRTTLFLSKLSRAVEMPTSLCATSWAAWKGPS